MTSFKHYSCSIPPHTYHYIRNCGGPTPILLIHGFPDTSFGWRKVIDPLAEMGYDVIAIDTLGYGESSIPDQLDAYSFKRFADDMSVFISGLKLENLIVIGHDWGAALAYRLAGYYPELVSALCTLCVPFMAPSDKYIPIEEIVKFLPNFKYQMYFASEQADQDLSSRDAIDAFLKIIYRPGHPSASKEGGGKPLEFFASSSKNYDIWDAVGQENFEKMVDQFYKNGMKGPLAYYKTRKINFDDEQQTRPKELAMPFLFIGAKYDPALPPAMYKDMPKKFPNKNFTMRECETGHWMALQDPETLLRHLNEWLPTVTRGNTWDQGWQG